jgi:CubicO group peptidase (beta-lactamase class C family)
MLNTQTAPWTLLVAALLAAPLVAADVVEGELGRVLDARMTSEVAKGFHGALLVARDGQIVLSKGYGYADPQNKVPFTSETAFDVGSITKQFTAAAIMRLEMEGKLSTEDPITKYFDEVPEEKRAITLHHLLTHSSGLMSELGGDYEVAPRDQVVRTMLAMRPGAKPGGRYRYSNGGYSMLAAIVEIASGQPYEQYLREKLFLPAGMKHTGYLLPDWSQIAVAHGVQRDGTDWGTPLDQRWGDDGPFWNLRGNGGILSTLGDMYRWHVALLGETVLSDAARQRIFTPHMPESSTGRTYYGYGWSIAKTRRGTKLITHNGGNGIFFADFHRFVDDGVVMIIASTSAAHSAQRFERDLLALIFPKPGPTAADAASE